MDQYGKDIEEWSILKKNINMTKQRPYFREREIWWCSVGINVGSEQNGKGNNFARPVLIYQKIKNNLFIGIPITSVLKEDEMNLSFYFEYELHTMLIFQIKCFDSKRLLKKMGTVSQTLDKITKKRVIDFLN